MTTRRKNAAAKKPAAKATAKKRKSPMPTPEELGLKRIDAAALARADGIKPIMDPRDAFAPFWPEDESADDFNEAVRKWRKEDGRAKTP